MTGPVPVAEADADADACVHAEGWLSLAAAPTFAAMALATAVQDAAAPAVLCSAMPYPGAVDRHGCDVRAHERLPFGAVVAALARRRGPAGSRLRGDPT